MSLGFARIGVKTETTTGRNLSVAGWWGHRIRRVCGCGKFFASPARVFWKSRPRPVICPLMVTQRDIDDLPFMKMHGLGNDFVVLDMRGRASVMSPALARAIGDRHRGVGFDQLAEIFTGTGDDSIELVFWNADGSTAGACGNATRSVAEYLLRGSGAASMSIRTERGLLGAVWEGDVVNVNMGDPVLDWAGIPLARTVDTMNLPLPGDPVAVGMGNPHCVFFVDDAEAVDVAKEGAAMEHDPLFPEATNVEFATVRPDGSIRMRVWERGTGITLACGSGACATAVAAQRRGLTDGPVRMELDGGWMTLDWRADGVWMAGPTMHVFDGVFTRDFLERV